MVLSKTSASANYRARVSSKHSHNQHGEDTSELIQVPSPAPIAKFWIPGVGIGKARPSLHWHRGEVYADYSDNYKDWINYAADVIHYQAQFFPPAPKPAKIVSKFVNFFSSDSDNLQGGVLDAMNGVYLEGDSSSFVTGSRGKFCKTRKRRGQLLEVGILVEVYPGGVLELQSGFSDRFVLPEFLATSPVRRRRQNAEPCAKRGIGKKTRERLLQAELSLPPVSITLDNSDLFAQYWIPGTGIGKARPYLHWHDGRLIKSYSRNYVNWMDHARAIIRYYSRSYPEAPKPARVEVKCVNFSSSDIDNLQGSPLDCMRGVYLGGDSSSYVTDCSGQFYKARKRRGQPKEVGMLVDIFRGEVEELEAGFTDEFDLPFHMKVSP